jgi:hypothetical protein
MNERIKELARQAGFSDFPNDKNGVWITDGYWDEQLENFAALIRQDEAQACAKHYVDIMRDAVEQAVAKEREACAKLCDDWLVGRDDICEVAAAIRGRDMYTKQENIDTSEECVHETDKSIHEDDDIQEYKRPWIGLSDVEVEIYSSGFSGARLVREIVGLLKERNT